MHDNNLHAIQAAPQSASSNNNTNSALNLLNAIFGSGRTAADIAKESALTPIQQFRQVIKAGVLLLDGEGNACRQLAIPPCKAACGLKPLVSRKHDKMDKVAIYLRCPESDVQVSQAIQNQAGIPKNSKFYVAPWTPASRAEGVQNLIKSMTDIPDLLVVVVDELKGDLACIDFKQTDQSLDEVHRVALEKDVTIFWLGDSVPLPSKAGTIRINQQPGQQHHTVTIEQEGLRSQRLVFEPNHGARLATHAKHVSEMDVIAYLKTEGGAKVKKAKVMERFALSSLHADKILKALIERGDAVKPDHGYYAAVINKTEQQ